MSYHCSLSAINVPSGTRKKRFFRLPQRMIATVPWRSVVEMISTIGYFPGEWKLSTNQYGHLLGLPHICGVLIARNKTIGLLWLQDGSAMEFHAGNFVGHFEEDE